MDSVVALLQALNAMSPIGVIALLALVIYKQVQAAKKVTKIETNDLHTLPDMLETLQRIEVVMSREFSYIRARLNGRGE